MKMYVGVNQYDGMEVWEDEALQIARGMIMLSKETMKDFVDTFTNWEILMIYTDGFMLSDMMEEYNEVRREFVEWFYSGDWIEKKEEEEEESEPMERLDLSSVNWREQDV